MPTTVSATEVQEVVYDALAEIGPDRSAITNESTWEQLDVDSLDLAELSQVVDERFGVRLKGDDVAQIKTVGDAIDLIVARTG